MDKKDIIKALECCRDMRNPPGYRFMHCIECPYEDKKHKNEKYWNCVNKMLEDAAKALKE